MGIKIKGLWAVLWLSGFCILSLLPFVFFRRCIHNDLAVQTFPLLLFANDAFRAKTLPLWNPFQDCGLPHFSNPQSHLWYLPHQIIFWTVGYSLYSLQYEFIFHFLLAGLGCYLLARRLNLSEKASCLSGISYMLSGLFVGHSEHLNIMVTFAWSPFIFAGIQGWFDRRTKKDLWLAGAGLWLLFSGGNPSTNLIALFFIGLFFAVRLVERIYEKGFNKEVPGDFLIIVSVFAVSGLISGITLLPAFADFKEYTGRQEALPYQMVLEFNPLRVWALLSLIFPGSSFHILQLAFWEKGSHTMLNCYFGIISLMLSLFAIYTKRDRKRLFLLALGLVGLIASLGGQAFLRGMLYEVFPFLRMMKHPALFRGFFILYFCILAGLGMDDLLEVGNNNVEKFRRIVLLLIISFGLILGFAFVLTVALARIDSGTATLLKDIFLESLPIQIALLIGFYFLLKGSRKFLGIWILLLASLDSSFMVYANMDLVGDYLDYARKKALIESIEKRNRNVDGITNLGRIDTWPSWQNNGMVYKKFETSNYTSIGSITYNRIMDSGFHKVVAEAPYFFMVREVSVQDQIEQSINFFRKASEENFMPAIVSEDPPLQIKVKPDVRYSIESLYSDSIRVVRYSINRVELEFFNNEPVVLGSTEGFHPGWRAVLDGEETRIIKFNYAFRGIYVLAPGVHKLVFEFKPKSFYAGIFVSVSGLFLLGLWTAFYFFKSRSSLRKNF